MTNLNILSCSKMNKNSSLRCSRDLRIQARDKTHEQRKPKKKRKNTDCENSTRFLKTIQEKVIQPRNENKSCKYVPPITQRTNCVVITCYPLSGADYSKPLLPADEMSYPTQVSEQQGSDEIVFSNGRSLSYIHGNDSFLQHTAPSGISTQFNELQNERIREVRTAPRENSERNIRKTYMNPPRHPEFIDFDKRLKSFARWFKQKPDPTSLCNAGFFFTNTGDLVRCYQCGIGLKDFSPADNPLNEHVKHSPECSYLQEYLGQDGLAKIKRKVIGDDMQLYESKTSRYRHPEYQAYPVRLSSFGKWPPCLMQKPEQLAEAGLYYTGFDDQVRCFACDGGLKKWDPEDDPWTEHCRWFPECPYVLEKKGEEYVRLVQKATATEIQKRLDTENIPADSTREPDISSEMERLSLKDPELDAVIKEHRNTCLEMGYQEKDFEIAARKLATNGNVRPTIEDILDAIESGEPGEDLSNNHSSETSVLSTAYHWMDFDMYPLPLIFQDDLHVHVHLKILRTLNKPVLDTLLYKINPKNGTLTEVPCIDGTYVGTCKNIDLCTLFNRMNNRNATTDTPSFQEQIEEILTSPLGRHTGCPILAAPSLEGIQDVPS